ncbi:hypothetical protein GALL_349130 [mine drainage metagenome]|uniref:Uncharacterized protein n=1 Tax=mine drainage metagenome TaxID=410659 RepID=A0A1J5QIG8_9ZZZZ
MKTPLDTATGTIVLGLLLTLVLFLIVRRLVVGY